MKTNIKPKGKVVALAKPYEPTDTEKAAMEATRARRIKTPRIKITPTETGASGLSLDHPDHAHGRALLMNAFGTGEGAFIDELLLQLGYAAANGQPNEQRLNFFAAVIKGIKPQDEVECLVAAQMAAIHSLTMDFATKLAHAGDLIWRDSAERTLNKLARTFTTQVETLKRYRSNGEQKVIVQHVSVSDGGQAAIVGAVSSMGPGGKEKPDSTP